MDTYRVFSLIHLVDAGSLGYIREIEETSEFMECNRLILVWIIFMTTALIKRCDLLGKLVIDQNTAEEIGMIAQLLVDVKTHRVVQIKCTSGFLARTSRYFKWDDIDRIDTDTVFINGAGMATSDPPASAHVMVGLEVWSDGDPKIGIINNYCVDLETGGITDYVFIAGGLAALSTDAYRLPHTAIIGVGRQYVTVMNEVLQSAEYFSPDLQDRLTQAFDFIKQGYVQTQIDTADSIPNRVVQKLV